MGSSLSLPLDWNKRARFALCLDELLDILMDRNGHNHVEGGGPVDLEKELHASSFDPWYSVRPTFVTQTGARPRFGRPRVFGPPPRPPGANRNSAAVMVTAESTLMGGQL